MLQEGYTRKLFRAPPPSFNLQLRPAPTAARWTPATTTHHCCRPPPASLIHCLSSEKYATSLSLSLSLFLLLLLLLPLVAAVVAVVPFTVAPLSYTRLCCCCFISPPCQLSFFSLLFHVQKLIFMHFPHTHKDTNTHARI